MKTCAILFMGIGLFWMTGCAPVMPPRALQGADSSLSFEQLKQDPEKHKGKTLVVGGTVIRWLDEPSGSRLEMLQRPLDSRLEPLMNDQTEGRFLVLPDERIKTYSLPRDQKITLVAEVVGEEKRRLNQIDYVYPLLKVREYHLWPEEPKYPRSNFFFSFGVSGSL